MNFEIRKLERNDIELARKLILMFGFDDETNSLPSDEYTSQILEKQDFYVIVALENHELIGGLTAYEMKMFKCETTEMFLYEIEVLEKHRRKGIGKTLVEFLKQICVEKGITEIFVGTEKDNFPARKLYSSTGGMADEDSVWFNYSF